MSKNIKKNKKVSEVEYVKHLIAVTKQNIKGDDSEIDRFFIEQFKRLNLKLKEIS